MTNKNDRFDFDGRVVERPITSEMEESFLDYAMSVIVSRALPDARDGLKPIHRRILWAMLERGWTSDKQTTKSAKITGEVMGNYHPHGNAAIYDAMVRMGQVWSLRYPLIHPQGNFGSIDGDSPGAERYTEAKLNALAEHLMADIKKETVDWVPNYDGSTQEPTVLPSGLPNLLMNGSEGIAVGMATRIPPHNLRELAAATIHLMDDPESSIDELVRLVPAPDFPTGGIILGNAGAIEAYKTGRGSITLRGRAEVEDDTRGKSRIVITELPYQVNKAALIEKIAVLAQQKKLEHIRDVRDESDKNGIRVVIELGAQAQPLVVLNNLYKHTQLQTNYSMNMLALRDGVPRLMNVRELLGIFIAHRRNVVRRRCEFDKRKAEERAHILEGLMIAQDNLDAVVKLIRGSKDSAEAKRGLVERFGLTEIQAQAILDMRLSQLTSLERQKILDELEALRKLIAELEALLADAVKLDGQIKKELRASAEKFGDDRRSSIAQVSGDGGIAEEELVPKEDVVVTMSRSGYLKRTAATVYRAQGRGGRGVTGQKTAAEDVIRLLVHTNTHDTLLCFTDRGVVHSLRVYKIPTYDRTAKGLPVINLLNLMPGERLTAMIPLSDFSHEYLFMCTALGTVKRVALSEFRQLRVTGKRAIVLDEGDTLDFVEATSGEEQIVITTRQGMAVKFEESQVRVMGTQAAGVRGVRLQTEQPDGDRVVGLALASDEESLLVAGSRGYGKRSAVELFRKTARGAKGVIAMRVTEKTGPVIGCEKVLEGDELLIITKNGMVIRTGVDALREMGRATQGVRLMNLKPGDEVSAIEVFRSEQEDMLI